jgi:hypothetical protein
MMGKETVFETFVFNSALTRLISGKDFVASIRRESFKSYIDLHYIYLCKANCSSRELLAEIG